MVRHDRDAAITQPTRRPCVNLLWQSPPNSGIIGVRVVYRASDTQTIAVQSG